MGRLNGHYQLYLGTLSSSVPGTLRYSRKRVALGHALRRMYGHDASSVCPLESVRMLLWPPFLVAQIRQGSLSVAVVSADML